MSNVIYDISSPILTDLRERIANGETISFGKTTMTLKEFFSQRPKEMLSLDGSEKVIKGNAKGYRTAILYLTASNASGVELCPLAAIAQCRNACLTTAGNGRYDSTQLARLRKTLFFNQYRQEALALIGNEIDKFYKASIKGGWTLLVRLNGTSDIRWENEGNLIKSRPHVQFYDYTKLHNRKGIPYHYDLTYSYSNVPAYLKFLPIALANPSLKRVAAVFRKRTTVARMLDNLETYIGLTVVDGDDTDIRHDDPVNTLVALYAKGKAKTDTTGFVIG
jgi:hypothetical protein